MVRLQSPDKQLDLVIAPELGGGVAAFTYKGIPVFRPAPDMTEAGNSGCFALIPYSNRIGYGTLKWGGTKYRIRPLFKLELHAIHGDGWRSSWAVERQSDASVSFGLNVPANDLSPYVYTALQEYVLTNGQLEISLSVENAGDIALPFGLGLHPFFPRTPDTVVGFDASKVWKSENMLSTELAHTPPEMNFAAGKPIGRDALGPPVRGAEGTDHLDECYADWGGQAQIEWRERGVRLSIDADPVFGHMCLYIPDKDFFCIEPVTNTTDGFNLAERGVADTGTIILQPGERLAGKIRFRVSNPE